MACSLCDIARCRRHRARRGAPLVYRANRQRVRASCVPPPRANSRYYVILFIRIPISSTAYRYKSCVCSVRIHPADAPHYSPRALARSQGIRVRAIPKGIRSTACSWHVWCPQTSCWYLLTPRELAPPGRGRASPRLGATYCAAC